MKVLAIGGKLFDFSGGTADVDSGLEDGFDCSGASAEDDAGADFDVVLDGRSNADKNEVSDAASSRDHSPWPNVAVEADADFMFDDRAVIDDGVLSDLGLRADVGVIADKASLGDGRFFAYVSLRRLNGDQIGGSHLGVDVKPLYIVADGKKIGQSEIGGRKNGKAEELFSGLCVFVDEEELMVWVFC